MHLSMMVETAKPVIYSGLLYTDKTHRGKKERKEIFFFCHSYKHSIYR